MKVVKIECPNCGKLIMFDKNEVGETGYCSFCGTRVGINYSPRHMESSPVHKSKKKFDLDRLLNLLIFILSGSAICLIGYIFIIMNAPL